MSDSRHASQRDRILALLHAAGPAGVRNVDLNHICFAYSQRIGELKRKFGWDIRTIQESRSVFRFVLEGKRGQQKRLFEAA